MHLAQLNVARLRAPMDHPINTEPHGPTAAAFTFRQRFAPELTAD